jgi:sterol 14-demethylase
MVVQLEQPCRVRYRRRVTSAVLASSPGEAARAPADGGACRVRVDLDLCQGHGECVSEAPEVFALDRATNRVALRSETPGPEQRERVERAVRHCPTRALSIQE